MTVTQRSSPPVESDVLLRQLTRHLARLRSATRFVPRPRAGRGRAGVNRGVGASPGVDADTVATTDTGQSATDRPASSPPAIDRPASSQAAADQPGTDLALAERIADTLRSLVLDTAQSSAADRARVRAAVHYFVLSRDVTDDRAGGGLLDEARVVNEILAELGRQDLLIR